MCTHQQTLIHISIIHKICNLKKIIGQSVVSFQLTCDTSDWECPTQSSSSFFKWEFSWAFYVIYGKDVQWNKLQVQLCGSSLIGPFNKCRGFNPLSLRGREAAGLSPANPRILCRSRQPIRRKMDWNNSSHKKSSRLISQNHSMRPQQRRASHPH